MIAYPQKHLVEGSLPFNLRLKSDHEPLNYWLLSTKIAVPDIIYKDDMPLYPFFWDTPEVPEWTPQYEFLVGKQEKHGAIHREWGTQPLNTYFRGHFCLKPHPRACEVGEFVLVQQYFKSGWWGHGDRITVKEQIMQNTVSFQLLRELGILKPGVNFFFMDQSKPTQETGGLEFKLFKGEDLPETYYEWLRQYFREWRAHDFNVPVNEVLDMLNCALKESEVP